MARLRITYRDGLRLPDEVRLGAFAQIAAKRRYGLDGLGDDPEPILFGAFVELQGPQAAKVRPVDEGELDAFDTWLTGVESFELVTEEPPVAETGTTETRTGSSPDSPPTSD